MMDIATIASYKNDFLIVCLLLSFITDLPNLERRYRSKRILHFPSEYAGGVLASNTAGVFMINFVFSSYSF